MKARTRVIAVLMLSILSLMVMGQGFDPTAEADKIWKWDRPEPYPPPMLGNMDIHTLSLLLDSGNLQWYQPRPVEDTWEGVIGMKIHASPEVVWKVMTDYEEQCRILPLTFLECQTEYRKGNEVKNNYKMQTSVLNYGFKFDMIDIVQEDPPYHLHINTIEGGLKYRELDLLLVPIDDNKNTLYFMRYYAHMKSLGLTMRAALAVLPMVEWPTAVNAANYHSRAYKIEAEKIAGYTPPPKPAPLDYTGLDLDTLHELGNQNAGLLRETPEGKSIDGLAYTFIEAPPNVVWDVLTDFENYDEIFENSHTTVEKREPGKVLVMQEVESMSILIFNIGYDLHAQYTLEPPYHLYYHSIDGTYGGSTGDLRLVPIKDGKHTLLFCASGLNIDNDDSLTMRIAKSGAFPFKTMMDLLAGQATLVAVKTEAEERVKGR